MIKDNKVYEYRTIKKDTVVYGTKVYQGLVGSKIELTLALYRTIKLRLTNLFKSNVVEEQKDAND